MDYSNRDGLIFQFSGLVTIKSSLNVEWCPILKRIEIWGGFPGEEEFIAYLGKDSIFRFVVRSSSERSGFSEDSESSGVPDDERFVTLFIQSLGQEATDHGAEFRNPFWRELLANVKKSLPVYEVMFQ